MIVAPASESDLESVATLVNSGYRGESSRVGWTTEADYLGGQRTDADSLCAELSTKPGAVILLLRDIAEGPLLGSIWLEPRGGGVWYLGMVTVRPDLQNRRLGRTVLEAAEAFAIARGAHRLRLTVINLRTELIAWYERRGYRRTGEVQPFPYDDEKFGEPLRPDLELLVLEKEITAATR